MVGKPFSSNPYVIGVPLTGKTGFYGRRELFVFIENILKAQRQNVVMLFGQRRIGKTSLLHQIALKYKTEGNVFSVYFDLQGKEEKSLGKVLYALARKMAVPLDIMLPEEAKFDDTGRFFHEEFFSSVRDQLGDRRLLLLFDEFDVLGDQLISPKAAVETLFPYLHKLIMHQHQLIFVFAVGRRIEELSAQYHNIAKQAACKRIGLLKENSARELITEPVRDVLKFKNSAIEAVLYLTGGHPYFTQLVCFETFNDMKTKNQRVVDEADILNVIDRTIESGHGALNWFWDGLPRAERFIMSSVAHVTGETGLATQESIRRILEKHKIVLTGLELKDAPARLVEWGMLRRQEDKGNYHFVVELVRRYILKMRPLANVRRDVDLISLRASRMYENAREAHTEGDLNFARKEYQRALNANPNHSGAQLGLAQVLFELGEVQASIEEFEKAYDIDDVSARDGLVRARQKQGKILEEAGQENEAIFQYDQAFKLAPSNKKTRLYLAAIWRNRGDEALSAMNLADSFEYYQKALQFDESETTARPIQDKLIAYVEHAKTRNDYEEAIQAIDQLKSLLPKNEVVLGLEIAFWTHRGETLAQEDQKFDEAIKAFQYALELNPGNDALTQKLHATRDERDRLFEAERLFNKAIDFHHDKEWRTAKAIWLQMVKMDILDYKGHNIPALLAEAHNRKDRRASMNLELIPTQQVIADKKITWKITVHNDGDDDLSKVGLVRGQNRLYKAFDLVAGEKQNITFTETYTKKGPRTEKITVTAVTSSGRVVNYVASTTVEVQKKL